MLLVLGCVVKASLLAVLAPTPKELLTSEVRPVLVAVSVYPVPTRLMLRPLKVATPLTALFVLVPASTAPLAPVPVVIDNVIDAVEDVIVLP